MRFDYGHDYEPSTEPRSTWRDSAAGDPPCQICGEPKHDDKRKVIDVGYEPTYKIIRFRFKGTSRVIKRGLSLEEAQAHCHRDDTHGEDSRGPWFDGYDLDGGWK